MQWQGESVRKVSGGRRRPAQMKRRAEIGLAPADTHIGEDRARIIRTYGGNDKVRALRASVANVTNPKNGEQSKISGTICWKDKNWVASGTSMGPSGCAGTWTMARI